ncbi:MAG: hypothetical protein J3R72DRAFT_492637 [Linnemannia gamsii]|nr:MAG: hypothetical protein J3R72DRAFT_492637 [Linnemannia gamsii]
MPHRQYHTKPINPYLAQPAINKRKNVTQACDRCRQRKSVCDGLRPACRRCYKDKVECTYAPLSYKRGPRIKPCMADSEPASTSSNYPDNKSHSADATDPSRGSACKLLASTDPFSKQVTDHLVEVFFEHNFQDYDFFIPVIFFQQYTRGTVSPDLLNAICAVDARHSDHPAVIQTPPYSSGQVYVDRVRARMMHLMS